MIEIKEYKGVRVAYRKSGTGQAVILLHGWGQNMQMMEKIEMHLKDSFCVYNLDFPGFGQSEDPKSAWGVCDYAAFLEAFVDANGIEYPILIGHSFGCRVAIRYAVKHDVKKMVLTGAAGIKPKLSLQSKVKQKVFKAGKWYLRATHQEARLEELKKNAGSEDYRNAKGVMKETFVKVVNDDVTDILKEVTCPTLLVWGEFDQAVPLSDGKLMEELMQDAGLAVFAGDDHFAYYHQADRFNAVLDVFLKEDK